jgi:hypothetical protein
MVIACASAAIAICDAAVISSAAGVWTVPITVVAGGGGIGRSSVAATSLGTSVGQSDRATAAGITNTLGPARHGPRHRHASPHRGPHHRNPRTPHPSSSTRLAPRRRRQSHGGPHVPPRRTDRTSRAQTRDALTDHRTGISPLPTRMEQSPCALTRSAGPTTSTRVPSAPAPVGEHRRSLDEVGGHDHFKRKRNRPSKRSRS